MTGLDKTLRWEYKALIRTVLIYTFVSFVFFATAISAVIASRTARKNGNFIVYNAAVYRACISGLLSIACILLVLHLFVKFPAVNVVSLLFFVSAGVLQIVSINRSQTIRLPPPKVTEGKAEGEVTTLAQDTITIWPPAPRIPDDEKRD